MFLACATVGLAIESANVVGYQQNPVVGYKMLTPTFENINSDTINIDEFEVKNATDGLTSIQVMNSDGRWTGTYYWFNAVPEMDLPAGWFDVNGEIPAGVTLNRGDAVFFYTEEMNVTAGNAGQVSSSAIVNDIAGYKMVGNCTPVAISIDQVEVLNATDGMTSVQVMNSEGRWTGTYYWFNAVPEMDLPAGWFDVNGEIPAGITLQPGDSIFFYTEENNIKAVIPPAI